MSEVGDPALIGRRVAGKFVVERFLGGGSMGAIYRARDDLLERKVALKVMNPEVAVDPSYVSRFHREAKAASRLDHPNSMRVIEFGAEPDGLLYMAMEYLEGRDLYKVIHEDWPLPEARIADVLMKALAGLAAAHEMGVIHRDLKPENIMILDRKDDEGQDIVKVCDFGIAKITETGGDPAAPDAAPKTAGAKLTTAGLVVGTPEYMSPEQARGEKLDARSDLYSMGIILYQLLTGRPPFMADNPLAVVLKHISDVPEPPHTIYPEVHQGLEAVCMHAIAKAKEERFQSARDMRAALRAAIEGRPIPLGTATSAVVDDTTSGTEAATAQQVSGSASGSHGSDRPQADKTPGDKRRSRAPLYIGIVVAALVAGVIVFVLAQMDRASSAPSPPSNGSSSTSPAVPSRVPLSADPRLPMTGATPPKPMSSAGTKGSTPSASSVNARH